MDVFQIDDNGNKMNNLNETIATASLAVNDNVSLSNEDSVAVSNLLCIEVIKNFPLNIIKNDSNADNDDNDLLYNAKKQFDIKMQAFNVLDYYYRQNYNTAIDDSLRYHDNDKLIIAPIDRCLHHLIEKIVKITKVLGDLANDVKFRYNMYIFVPYIKQMKNILKLFVNDYCCNELVNKTMLSLSSMIDNSENLFSVVNAINKRARMMLVFTEPELYFCNICNNTSAEKHFIKASRCCGYEMCNPCYAKLWEFSSLYPLCPVCKTSFKTSNQLVSKLHES